MADFVSMTPELSSLFAAVKAAELVETLSGGNQTTARAKLVSLIKVMLKIRVMTTK